MKNEIKRAVVIYPTGRGKMEHIHPSVQGDGYEPGTLKRAVHTYPTETRSFPAEVACLNVELHLKSPRNSVETTQAITKVMDRLSDMHKILGGSGLKKSDEPPAAQNGSIFVKLVPEVPASFQEDVERMERIRQLSQQAEAGNWELNWKVN